MCASRTLVSILAQAAGALPRLPTSAASLTRCCSRRAQSVRFIPAAALAMSNSTALSPGNSHARVSYSR